MADSNAMADIRGLDIDKLAKGFADEEIILKKFLTVTNTSAREIRWYQKTSGFLTGVTSTGITASSIANVSEKARPFVVEQSWTRNTSYVRKYFVESPLLSDEDIKDSDIDILATNIRDLVKAVEYQVETRIFNVMSENGTAVNINSVTANAAWDTASYTGVNAVEDILDMMRLIRVNGYNPQGAVLLLNPLNYKSLLTYLIDGRGSSIPGFSSQKVESGVMMEILGVKVVVSTVVIADHALMFVPQVAATWKTFMPITARQVEEVGIGTKIRVWEEGECILTDPKAVCILENTDA